VNLDRAATNVKALRLLKERTKTKPLVAYCISHGYSGCGKKHTMVEGRKVLKQLTKMVQHKLYKARTFFIQLFGEVPLKMGGVRWGIELEMCTQVNKIGLPRLYNQYLTVCHQQNK
jgi:hypothetical protein